MALRIGNPLTQHLIAAANAEHGATPPRMGNDVMIPTLCAQESEIAKGRFGPEQKHDIRVPGDGRARRHEEKVDIRLLPQGIRIIEIGHAGEHGRSDAYPSLPGSLPA